MTYERKLKPSASKISLYQKCHRKFFYHYILKINAPKTLPLIKGSACHTILEQFFDTNPRKTSINVKNYKTELYIYTDKLIDKVINEPSKNFNKIEPSYSDQIRELCKNDFEFAVEINDVKTTIHNYLILYIMELENYIKRYNNYPQAYYMSKPRFREFEIDLPNLVGFIDSVFEKDGLLFIRDYKTSSIFRTLFDESYVQQLKLYAYAWYVLKGVVPDIGSLMFLKYGKEMIIEFDKQNVVREMEELINDFCENTKSTNIDSYKMNTEHQFCTCCKSKNPDGFKNGGGCWYARFCNQELGGFQINYNIEV